MEGKKRMSLDLSPELSEALGNLSDEMRVTKSEVVRKALGLMEVLQDEKKATGGKVDFIMKNTGTGEATRLIGI